MSPRNTRIAAIAAIALWALVSLAFLVPVWQTPTLAIRGDDYWAMSEWFAALGPYPHSYFGPGFPLIIHLLRGAGITLFGLIVVQKLMVGLTGLVLYRLGRLLGLSELAAIAAAGAYTIFPVVQANSSLVFAETPYLLFSTLAVTLIIAQAKQPARSTLAWLTLAFALLGFAALVRGNALVLWPACGLIALARLPWTRVLVAGLIGAAPVLGWSALNYHWYGYFKPTSSGDAAVAASLVGPVMTELEGRPRFAGPDVWIDGPWQAHYANLFEFSRHTRELAIEYAKAHPGEVIHGNIKGWVKTLVGPGRNDFDELLPAHDEWLTILSLAIRGLLLAGLVAYVATGAARRQLAFSVVLAAMLLAHVAASGAAGYSRFGFPVDAYSVLALALAWQAIAAVWGSAPAGDRQPRMPAALRSE
ncbi:MAG: hypothetical protein AB7G13_19315 [Lautropia sp.]